MFNWLLRLLADKLSRHGNKNRINVLNYHRVGESYSAENPEKICWPLFRLQIHWLNKYFTVLPLPLALELQAANKLPPRVVCITIDDGYRDSYDFIFKALAEEEITGTFFISTKGLVAGRLWDEEIYHAVFHAPEPLKAININGKLFAMDTLAARVATRVELTEYTKYLPLIERDKVMAMVVEQTQTRAKENVFLTPEQIKEMHFAGMTIGAHTHNHPILTSENDDVVLDEIRQSKVILEKILEQEVEYFSYPNGKYPKDFNDNHIEIVKALGFKAALSTNWGALTDVDVERYKIKRFTPWDDNEYKFVLRLALNYLK